MGVEFMNKLFVSVYAEDEVQEFAELKVYGKNIDASVCEIQLRMSKEALLGFATYAIRIANTTDDDFRHHWQVEPLSDILAGQPLGFFLTNSSPSFVIMCNQLNEKIKNEKIWGQEIPAKNKFRFKYEIPLEVNENVYEPFEIGFANIVDIKVIDKESKDITNRCGSIVLRINRNGLLEYGKNLLRLAHNYEVTKHYLLSHVKGSGNEYNMGILLLEDSSQLRIICVDNGNIFNHIKNFEENT